MIAHSGVLARNTAEEVMMSVILHKGGVASVAQG